MRVALVPVRMDGRVDRKRPTIATVELPGFEGYLSPDGRWGSRLPVDTAVRRALAEKSETRPATH